MEIVKVYSPVEDKEIRNNLNASPIWKQAYHEDEFENAKRKHSNLYEYSIKFDGLKPIQLTNMKRVGK
jgi:hypothetical protein